MPRFKHPIVAEVAALGLPDTEQTVITHGSALVVRGIREPHEDGDIDLVTSSGNSTYLREVLGWKKIRRTTGYTDDGLPKTITQTISPDGRFDVYLWDFIPKQYQETGKGRVYLDELITNHSERDDHTGIWVAKPEFVLRTKQDTGREKDLLDIRLIDEHMKRVVGE